MSRLQTIVAELPALVIGTGPSHRVLEGIAKPAGAKWYGAGTASHRFPLDVYGIGDAVQEPHLPTYPCRVVASYPDFQLRPDIECWLDWPFSEVHEISHGCSSGGLATSLACLDFPVVGLIGFDGFLRDGKPSDEPDWLGRHRLMLERWLAKGKRLVSLMPVSVFNDILENPFL